MHALIRTYIHIGQTGATRPLEVIRYKMKLTSPKVQQRERDVIKSVFVLLLYVPLYALVLYFANSKMVKLTI